nr:immunoglobulin light chain junction region [Macaca mulatta]MOX82605.1 immunoglobulin light chain junction region [Macaca mulatta]
DYYCMIWHNNAGLF